MSEQTTAANLDEVIETQMSRVRVLELWKTDGTEL